MTPERQERIVDAVIELCAAMGDNDTPAELTELFEIALQGGVEYAAVKMTMIAMALGEAGKRRKVTA